MGAQKSIHAGKAKIDVNVDLSHKLCAALMLSPLRNSGGPLSLIIGSLCIKHPNLFGGSEKLDVFWDKGLYDTNVVVAYRRPRPKWRPQQSLVVQHSISPEIGVHGLPIDNFSQAGSGGVNLCRSSVGLELSEPASSNWSSTTSIKFEHVRPVNDEGRQISRDLDGFSVTSSGGCHDSMVVLKQQTRYAKANDNFFTRFSLQIEQGIPVFSKWLVFNRVQFVGTKGLKLGPAFLMTSVTGGLIVGDMAPYQAFAIVGLGSVRGYGEGGVGTGRSCLVANSELTFPLSKMLEVAFFMDYGSDPFWTPCSWKSSIETRKSRNRSGYRMWFAVQVTAGSFTSGLGYEWFSTENRLLHHHQRFFLTCDLSHTSDILFIPKVLHSLFFTKNTTIFLLQVVTYYSLSVKENPEF